MNTTQRTILVIAVLIVVGMLLFPPFQITIKGTEMNMGYNFLFNPPKRGYLRASVNVAFLLVQWLAVLLVGGAAWIFSRDGYTLSTGNPKLRKHLEIFVFGFLRTIRLIFGLISAWQIFGFFPILTWFSNLSAVTGEMLAIVVVKMLVMLVFGSLFFGLRAFIHYLHNRWYGSPHPSLFKKMAI